MVWAKIWPLGALINSKSSSEWISGSPFLGALKKGGCTYQLKIRLENWLTFLESSILPSLPILNSFISFSTQGHRENEGADSHLSREGLSRSHFLTQVLILNQQVGSLLFKESHLEKGKLSGASLIEQGQQHLKVKLMTLLSPDFVAGRGSHLQFGVQALC